MMRPPLHRPPIAVLAVVLAAALLLGSAPAGAGPAVFPDVPPDHPFHDDVEWAVDLGITTGYPDGGFHPAAPVTRQAMAAFLVRFIENRLQVPVPFGDEEAPATSEFVDVPLDHPFHDEIAGIAALGITTGFADGGFHPSAPVTRQAMAAFVFRLGQEVIGFAPFPAPEDARFRDVGPTHRFFLEVEWLAAAQLTTGFADGGFHPGAPVSRQATMAFLHRLSNLLLN